MTLDLLSDTVNYVMWPISIASQMLANVIALKLGLITGRY